MAMILVVAINQAKNEILAAINQTKKKDSDE